MNKPLLSMIMLAMVAVTAASAGAQATASAPASQPADAIRERIRKVWLDNVLPLPARVSPLPQLTHDLQAMEITSRKEAAPSPSEESVAQSQPTSQPRVVEMSAEALEKIKLLAGSDIADRAVLADDLYAAGQFAAAAILYDAVLKKQNPADKDWLEFQLGNCQVKSNPTAAMAAYRKLADEFPNSPWTPLAVTKARLMQQQAEARAAASQPASKAPGRLAVAPK